MNTFIFDGEWGRGKQGQKVLRRNHLTGHIPRHASLVSGAVIFAPLPAPGTVDEVPQIN
jgi:hypothetical protein